MISRAPHPLPLCMAARSFLLFWLSLLLLPLLLVSCSDTTIHPMDKMCAQYPELVGIPCGTNEGVCTQGITICRNEQLYCLGGNFGRPETCDGVDNSCSGKIDDLPFDGFCYDGPEGTAIHGICRPGLTTCVDGSWRCLGQILPEVETPCDGIDQSCTGFDLIPTSTVSTRPIDFLLIGDWSASIKTYLPPVKAALYDFLDRYQNDPRFRYWFIDLPGVAVQSPHSPNRTCHPTPEEPLLSCSARTFRMAIDRWANDHGGLEPSYDAIIWAVQNVAWTPNSFRYILLVEDEEGQTFSGNDQLSVIAALGGTNTRVSVFTDIFFSDYYDQITQETGGSIVNIRDPTQFTPFFEDNFRPIDCE